MTAPAIAVSFAGNSKTVTYNGTEQTVQGATFTPDSSSIYKQMFDWRNVLYDGEAFASACEASGTTAGTYTFDVDVSKMSYSNSNVNVTFTKTSNITLVINKAEISNDESCPVSFSYSDKLTYNGSAQLPDVSATITSGSTQTALNADDFVIDTDKSTKQTNVGEGYNIYIKCGANSNFTVASDFALPWQIVARSVKVTTSADKDVDGSVLSANITNDVTSNLVDGHVISGTLSTNSAEAGTYALNSEESTITASNVVVMSGSSDVTANYSVSYDVSMAIGSKTIAGLTFDTSGLDALVYDGTTHQTTIDAVPVKNGETVLVKDTDYTVSTATGVNVGTYSITFTGKSGSSYTGSKTIEYKIAAAEVTVNVSESKTYDKQAFSATYNDTSTDSSGNSIISGLAAGEGLSVSVATSGSSAGVYTNDTTATDTAGKLVFSDLAGRVDAANNIKAATLSNYKITYSGSVEIAKKQASVVIDETAQYTAENISKSYSVTSAKYSDGNILSGDTLTVGVATTASSVGEYTYVSSAEKNSLVLTEPTESIVKNYTLTYDLKLTITKAALSVAFNCSKDFDGSVLSVDFASNKTTNGVTVSGIKGTDVITGNAKSASSAKGTYTYSSEGEEVVVTSSIEPQTSTQNYTITYSGTLTINASAFVAADLDVTYTNSLTYNASAQDPTTLDNFAVTYKGTTLTKGTDYTLTSSAQTEANTSGSYSFTVRGAGNYSSTEGITKE